jgi:hypothetical protein
MRRALVVLAALVVVAGAFAAGALIFRDGGGEKVVESQLTCAYDDTDADCDGYVEDELDARCGDGVDAVKIMMVYENDDGETPPRSQSGHGSPRTCPDQPDTTPPDRTPNPIRRNGSTDWLDWPGRG